VEGVCVRRVMFLIIQCVGTVTDVIQSDMFISILPLS